MMSIKVDNMSLNIRFIINLVPPCDLLIDKLLFSEGDCTHCKRLNSVVL